MECQQCSKQDKQEETPVSMHSSQGSHPGCAQVWGPLVQKSLQDQGLGGQPIRMQYRAEQRNGGVNPCLFASTFLLGFCCSYSLSSLFIKTWLRERHRVISPMGKASLRRDSKEEKEWRHIRWREFRHNRAMQKEPRPECWEGQKVDHFPGSALWFLSLHISISSCSTASCTNYLSSLLWPFEAYLHATSLSCAIKTWTPVFACKWGQPPLFII